MVFIIILYVGIIYLVFFKFRLLQRREAFINTSVDNNLQAYTLARKQYDVGQIDLLSVLQMQSRWTGARVTQVNIKNQRLAQRIDLHLALGGSFETEQGE